MARSDKGMPLFEGIPGFEPDETPRRVNARVGQRDAASARPPEPPPPSDDDLPFDLEPADVAVAAPAPSAPSSPPAASQPPPPQPGDRDNPLTVSAILKVAHMTLEDRIGWVWIEGEVTEIKRPSSGHLYFTLKDEGGSVAAVMWRSDARRLRFKLQDGLHLRCRGRLGIFSRTGKFQVYVNLAEPAGKGAEALALEQLKQKLASEGLFEVARKRGLPSLPRRIGVITSRTGAAVRDIVRVVHRRFPVPILLASAQVQGADAPRQLCMALEAICRHDVDVVIIGRGGGSATDLSAFNDERVVRAVAACRVPTISAVGHEVDITLTDLVADRRAATPSQAGELAVPVLADLAAALEKEQRRMQRELLLRLRTARQEIDTALERGATLLHKQVARRRHALSQIDRQLAEQHPRTRIAHDRAELSSLAARATESIRRRCHASARSLAQLGAQLDAMSPLRVLDRGYALATAGEHVLTASDQVGVGDAIEVRLAAGALDCRVEGVHAPEQRGDDDEGKSGGA